eukprot:TRINITY_DN1000_c0_g1_i2.p1 TRINITY_DN1000_c0_g1~~TRINITY_DN1000_c0_g1_i2.p1  ORF type:complete len:2875 (-),score=567.01 TRINITY_DN1000_c0_g1_i2:1808-10432(-)
MTITSQSATQVIGTVPAMAACTNCAVQVSSTSRGVASSTALTVYPQPIITSLTPTTLPYSGGTLTITGTNLGGGDITSVTIASTAVTVTSQSDTQVVVTVPTLPACVNCALQTESTSRGAATSTLLTIFAEPQITSVTPVSLPWSGGTVTVTGTGLGSGTDITAVHIDSITVTVTAQSGTTVTVTVPASATPCATCTITVQSATRGESTSNALQIFIAGTVSAYTPPSLPFSGGTVTITGANIGSGSDITSVSIGPISVNIVAQSASTVTVVQTGPGLVANSDSTVVISSASRGVTTANGLVVYAQPVITTIAPDSIPSAVDNQLTITGTGLGSGTDVFAVSILGQPSVILSQSANVITINTGELGPCTSCLVLINSTTRGAAVSTDLTVNPPGSITSYAPSSLPYSGGLLSINGTGLGNGQDISLVVVGTVTANIVGQTADSVVVQLAGQAASAAAAVQVKSASRGVTTSVIVINPAGALLSVYPNSIPLAPIITTLTISGTNLGSGSDIEAVTVNGQRVSQIVSQDAQQVVVTVAPNANCASCSVAVLSVTFGQTSATGLLQINIVGTIVSYVPPTTPFSGGTVTISGTGLGNGTDITTVTVGSIVTLTPLQQTSDTVVIELPEFSVSGCNPCVVTVMSASRGNAVGQYIIHPEGLASVVPNTLPYIGGVITISGTNLAALPSDITSLTVCGNTELYSVSGTAGVVTQIVVTVTKPGFSADTFCNVTIASISYGVTAVSVEVFAQANLVSATPSNGPVVGGNLVTIVSSNKMASSGSDYQLITFNGTSAGTPVTGTDTSVVVAAPAASGNGGAVSVCVTSAHYSVSCSVLYSYNPHGIINTVQPTSIPYSGQLITISGIGLINSDLISVVIGTVPLVAQSGATSESIVAMTPYVTTQCQNCTLVVSSTSVGVSDFSPVTINPVPHIDIVYPTTGPNVGGTTVTLTSTTTPLGSGTDITSVTLCDVTATVVFQSDTAVTVTTPAMSAAGALCIVQVNSTSFGMSSATFLYHPHPEIASFSPLYGPHQGGNTITIISVGNFGNGSDITMVQFGAQSVAAIVSQSVSAVTVTAPVCQSANVVNDTNETITVMSVSYGVAVSTQPYKFHPSGVITQVTPVSVPLSGSTITIWGTNLGDSTDITSAFIGSYSVGITVQNASHVVLAVQAVSTACAGCNLTLNSVTYGQTLYQYVTINPAGTIDFLAPNNGPLAGNLSVTIFGTNLGNGSDVTLVTICGVAAEIQSQGTGQILVRTGQANIAGPGPVVVNSTTFGMSVSGANNVFTYNSVGSMTQAIPSTGPHAGGNTITIIAAPGKPVGKVISAIPIITTDMAVSIYTGSVLTLTTNITALSFSNTVNVQSFSVVLPPFELFLLQPQSVNIVVKSTFFGESASNQLYSYNPAGIVTSIVPPTAPITGATITIHGTYLLANATTDLIAPIMLAGTPFTIQTAASTFPTDIVVSYVNTARVSCQQCNVTIQSVTYGVTESSPVLFTINYAPSITAFVPFQGPLTANNYVTVIGSNLGAHDITNLTICNITARIVTQSATAVVFVAPPVQNSTVCTVVMESTSFGQSSLFGYQYNKPGIISSIVPNLGPSIGGTNVTIQGFRIGQNDITAVYIAGVAVNQILEQTNDTVVVQLGASGMDISNGKVVVISTSIGNSSLPNAFTYSQCVSLTSCSSCGAVIGCGWCSMSDRCLPLSFANSLCPDPIQFTTNPFYCPCVADGLAAISCVQNTQCQWVSDDFTAGIALQAAHGNCTATPNAAVLVARLGTIALNAQTAPCLAVFSECGPCLASGSCGWCEQTSAALASIPQCLPIQMNSTAYCASSIFVPSASDCNCNLEATVDACLLEGKTAPTSDCVWLLNTNITANLTGECWTQSFATNLIAEYPNLYSEPIQPTAVGCFNHVNNSASCVSQPGCSWLLTDSECIPSTIASSFPPNIVCTSVEDCRCGAIQSNSANSCTNCTVAGCLWYPGALPASCGAANSPRMPSSIIPQCCANGCGVCITNPNCFHCAGIKGSPNPPKCVSNAQQAAGGAASCQLPNVKTLSCPDCLCLETALQANPNGALYCASTTNCSDSGAPNNVLCGCTISSISDCITPEEYTVTLLNAAAMPKNVATYAVLAPPPTYQIRHNNVTMPLNASTDITGINGAIVVAQRREPGTNDTLTVAIEFYDPGYRQLQIAVQFQGQCLVSSGSNAPLINVAFSVENVIQNVLVAVGVLLIGVSLHFCLPRTFQRCGWPFVAPILSFRLTYLQFITKRAELFDTADSASVAFLTFMRFIFRTSLLMALPGAFLTAFYAVPDVNPQSNGLTTIFGVPIEYGMSGFGTTAAGALNWKAADPPHILPLAFTFAIAIIIPAMALQMLVRRTLAMPSDPDSGRRRIVHVTQIRAGTTNEQLSQLMEDIAGMTPSKCEIYYPNTEEPDAVGHSFVLFPQMVAMSQLRRMCTELDLKVNMKYGPTQSQIKLKNLQFYSLNTTRKILLRILLTVLILFTSGMLASVYIVKLYLQSPVFAYNNLGSDGSDTAAKTLASFITFTPTIGIVLVSRILVAFVSATHKYDRHISRVQSSKALFYKYVAVLFVANLVVPVSVFLGFSILLTQNLPGYFVSAKNFPNLLNGAPVSTFSLVAGEYMFNLFTSAAIIGPAVDLMRLPLLFRMFADRCRGRRFSSSAPLTRKQVPSGSELNEKLLTGKAERQSVSRFKDTTRMYFPYELRFAQTAVVFVTACCLGFVFPLLLVFVPFVIFALQLYDRYVLDTFAVKALPHIRPLQTATLTFMTTATVLLITFHMIGFVVIYSGQFAPSQGNTIAFAVMVGVLACALLSYVSVGIAAIWAKRARAKKRQMFLADTRSDSESVISEDLQQVEIYQRFYDETH